MLNRTGAARKAGYEVALRDRPGLGPDGGVSSYWNNGVKSSSCVPPNQTTGTLAKAASVSHLQNNVPTTKFISYI